MQGKPEATEKTEQAGTRLWARVDGKKRFTKLFASPSGAT
jgi:hypothetical protein